MPEVEPITREEKLWSGENIEPITREEQYIKHIYDKTQKIPSKPITRKEMLLERAGEGGGSDVTIKQLSVTENGTYSEENTAYSPVIVNVPKTPLSKLTVTENGTYTAPTGTGYDEVAVDVPLPPNAYLLKEVEGVEIASFSDGADFPMPSLKVAIEPIQEGSGDPSPTNIRPISGFTEANVTRCGVNVWDEEWELGTMNRTTGGNSSSTDAIRAKNFNRCKGGQSYYCKIANYGLYWMMIIWYDENQNYIDGEYCGGQIVTAPNNAAYFKVATNTNASSRYGSTYNNDISINYPSTDTEYHAYNGQTYNVEFTDGSNPLTVYGGTLDVVSGELVVNRANVVLDGSNDETWASDTDVSSADGIVCFRAYLQNNNIKKPEGTISSISYIGKMLSDTMPTLKNGYVNQYPMANTVMGITGYSGANNNYFYININKTLSNIQSVTELRAWLAENPTTVCYELATPQTYQLTPTQVKSLLGTNNVWADTGDIEELEYFSKEA